MKSKEIGIGKKLRKVRIHNGVTQQELADRFGVTKAVISLYEQNKTMPNFAMLVEMAKMFNVSTDYLLSFGDEHLDEIYDVSPAEVEPEHERKRRSKARKLGSRFMAGVSGIFTHWFPAKNSRFVSTSR